MDMTALDKLGIDTEEGLAYCADDPEFYEEMLAEFIAEGSSGYSDLKEHFENRDWKHYGISAHTIKSTSRMIGAKALSDKARELETACKEENSFVLIAEHDSFAAELAELLNGLRAVTGSVTE
jgi:HPt (histidine-containing phosphotransfer) domain-containing protein